MKALFRIINSGCGDLLLKKDDLKAFSESPFICNKLQYSCLCSL